MEINKVLNIIRKLNAVADDPKTHPDMAANYRAKAEKLMQDYRVEQEHLIAEDPTAMEPELVEIAVCRTDSPYSVSYQLMFQWVAMHCQVRVVFYNQPHEGEYTLVAHTVGYASDLRYAEYLYTAAQTVFSDKVEPAFRPELTAAENIYRLRSSGMERNKVARLVFNEDTHSSHAKVGKIYKEECEKRGERPALNGRAVNAKTFREVYAREFTYEFERRLRAARMGADAMGGGMVLAGREERVNEAFYKHFPFMRPSTGVAERGECEKCKKTKHVSKKCPAHRDRPMTQAERERINRLHYSAAAQAGGRSGRAAAAEVDIHRTKRASRLDEDSTRNTTGLEIDR